MRRLGLGFIFMLMLSPALASGESPIEVQKLTAGGKYFQALAVFEKLPKRQISSSVLEAAARSAWALGLTEKAGKYFDQLLREGELSSSRKARVLLMRGILELQEERPRVSMLFAERAYQLLPTPTKLRGSVLMLWGDAFTRLRQHGAAMRRYEQAKDEVAHELVPELSYRIGKAARMLGELPLSLESFQKVPVSHERAPKALRALAELSLEQQDFPAVRFWLTQGREMYPDEFLDSWVDYALACSAAGENDRTTLHKIRRDASAKYPPSDSWISLLEAIAEKVEWTSDKGQ